MENRKPKRYCPYCGEQLEFYFDRDYDHLGPIENSGTWKQCDHKCTKPFKKMCLNCKYLEYGKCTNTKALNNVIESINKVALPFVVDNLVFSLKDNREHCDVWEVNEKIASQLFK